MTDFEYRFGKWIDRGYWLLSFLLIFCFSLFPEQIVEFWGWMMKRWIF